MIILPELQYSVVGLSHVQRIYISVSLVHVALASRAITPWM